MLIFSWKLDESRKMSQISIWPSLWCMYIAAHNLKETHNGALIITIDRLMSQGYKVLLLENLFKKFYDRYHDLIEKYQRSVKEIVNLSFPWYNLLYIQRDFSHVFIILHRFVTWVCHYFISLIAVLGVMHKADNAYSVPSTWSCYWLDQFLTPAYSTRTLSKNFAGYFVYYIAHFTGC